MIDLSLNTWPLPFTSTCRHVALRDFKLFLDAFTAQQKPLSKL